MPFAWHFVVRGFPSLLANSLVAVVLDIRGFRNRRSRFGFGVSAEKARNLPPGIDKAATDEAFEMLLGSLARSRQGLSSFTADFLRGR